MASADRIEVPDIKRLLSEIIFAEKDRSPDDWCEAEGIDEDVFDWLFEQIGYAVVAAAMAGTFSEGIGDEDDAPEGMQAINGSMAINSIVGTAFQIGWEAHKQYR